MNNCKAILFDLDGTLIDTWEDLMLAANVVLKKHGYAELKPDEARLKATDGMIALLQSSMKTDIDKYDKEVLKNEFLDYYSHHMSVKSKLFDGMSELLKACRNKDILWGIVTNKPSFLTNPLIKSFSELKDCAVIVCSDTVKEKKPHPEPLLHALRIINIKPQDVMYVGDHIRDIECGNNANATTIAAAWGYIKQGDDINNWHADFICQNPLEIINIIKDINSVVEM